MIFKAAEKMGWNSNVKCDFMGFGVIQGEDGGKFKTRSGDTVKLMDVIDEGKTRALS